MRQADKGRICRGSEAGPRWGSAASSPQERLHAGRAPPGLADVSCWSQPPQGQGPVPASCPGLEPPPCLPSSPQQGCPKGSGRPRTPAEGSPGVLRGIAAPLPPSASGTHAKTWDASSLRHPQTWKVIARPRLFHRPRNGPPAGPVFAPWKPSNHEPSAIRP